MLFLPQNRPLCIKCYARCQERMLKFTFLLQHHVRHRLPYAPLIFTHVVESLVFVPIMVSAWRLYFLPFLFLYNTRLPSLT